MLGKIVPIFNGHNGHSYAVECSVYAEFSCIHYYVKLFGVQKVEVDRNFLSTLLHLFGTFSTLFRFIGS